MDISSALERTSSSYDIAQGWIYELISVLYLWILNQRSFLGSNILPWDWAFVLWQFLPNGPNVTEDNFQTSILWKDRCEAAAVNLSFSFRTPSVPWQESGTTINIGTRRLLWQEILMDVERESFWNQLNLGIEGDVVSCLYFLSILIFFLSHFNLFLEEEPKDNDFSFCKK